MPSTNVMQGLFGIVNSVIKIYLFFVFNEIYVTYKFYLLMQELTNSNFQGTFFTA